MQTLSPWRKGLGFPFVLLLCACVSTPPKPTQFERGDYKAVKHYLAAVIKRDMAKYDVKGLSIALVDNQKVTWAEGFGYADTANQVPATAHTVYRIGSITKLMTATEIMRLASQGKVELDQPVTAYVADFSIHSRFAHSKPMTLRALLAHHSGLPSDVLKGMWVDHPVTLAEYVASLRDESLASPPQSLYKYSNIDFSLLGRVIEKVEHQAYPDAMRKNLLMPLGMADSSFALSADIERRLARGYRKGEEVKPISLRDTPAGGMLSSANDMSRWLRFIFADGSAQGAQIMQAGTLHRMFMPQFQGIALDFGHKMGLAWMLSGVSVPGGQTVAWHNGGYPPYQAHVSLLPEQKLGVVILANSDEASQFITQLGALALDFAYATQSGVPPPQGIASQAGEPVQIPRDMLGRYAGHYAMFNGQLGTIALDGDQLKTSLFGRRFTLQPMSDDTFRPKASVFFGLISIPIDSLSVRFQTLQSKDVAVLSGLPAPFAFEKLPPAAIPDVWRRRVGRYQTDTTEEQFDFKQAELAIESGMLVFKTVIASKNVIEPGTDATFALRVIDDHTAAVAGIGNGEGGVMRVIDAGQGAELVNSGFTLSGFRFVPMSDH